MPFGADDLEPGLGAGQVEILAQFDVGAAAGHVGRDHDRRLLARTGHDLRLALVILGVQHFVLEAAALELPGEGLGDIHVHGADQDRPAEPVQPLDLGHDRVVLFLPGLVDPVGLVHPA